MKSLIKLGPQIRSDRQGHGAFGAPRGSRTHNGIDYVANAGDYVCSPVTGIITKYGYPYPDDLSYRYVEITSEPDQLRHRLFYTSMLYVLQIQSKVKKGEIVALVQDIAARYPADDPKDAMINHVHYEIRRPDGTYMNPEDFDTGSLTAKDDKISGD